MKRISHLSIISLLLTVGAGMYCITRLHRPVVAQQMAEEVTQRAEAALAELDASAKQILTDSANHLPESEFRFFVVSNDSVVAWNDHHFIPSVFNFSDSFNIKFLRTGVGDFLIKKWSIHEDKILVGLLPLHTQYKIQNEYLRPHWNTDIFKTAPLSIAEPESTQGVPVLLQGNIGFRIVPHLYNQHKEKFWGYASVFFLSLSIGVILYIFSRSIHTISDQRADLKFILIAGSVLVVRLLMIYCEFPARFIKSSLFDPQVFASSQYNSSLGDLLLNAIAIFYVCFALFQLYPHFSFFRKAGNSVFYQWILSSLTVVFILFGFLFPYVVIQTIYNNSSITLSISKSIDFDILRIVTFLSVLFCWVSSFLFIHVFVRILMFQRSLSRITISILIGSIIFFAINVASGQHFISSLFIGVMYVCIVVFFGLYRQIQIFRYTAFVYFFIAILAFSFNGVISVAHFEEHRRAEAQLRFADHFLEERDYFAEYLLQESAARISNDAFIQTRLATPLLGKEIVKQKITQVFLSGYLNRYSATVLLFNSLGEPLEDVSSKPFSDILALYDQETYRTDYKNIYFVADSKGDFARRYVALIPLLRNSSSIGYIVIELSLKRIIPENVYPELLVDNQFQESYHAQDLSYAVIDHGSVLYSASDFNYTSFAEEKLGDAKLYTQGIQYEGYLHIATEDSNSHVTVVSSPSSSVFSNLSDFSLQVLIGVVVVFLFLTIRGLVDFSKSRNLYLAARIQLILNLAIFLPLLVVCVITLTLTTRSSLEQLNANFLSKARKFSESVTDLVINSKSDASGFESEFNKITSLANLDANVFSPKGILLATSQPLVFDNHLFSSYINPKALRRIANGDKTFITTERVGSLQFYTAYTTLFSPESGAQVGILAIPFFQSASSLEGLQREVLSNILSVFTLLFILLLFISFFVTRWLTAPLNLITKTLGRISLTQENKPLLWTSNDEIGLMIREYNLMLEKLKISLKELERNQRESTWREIAQQVAHEVKNPLTPMKLTLQQLERMLDKDAALAEKFNKPVQSLLAQVNTLNSIASSFSSFAKMPEPIIESIELNSLIATVVNLHAHQGAVRMKTSITHAMVLADESLLSRIFSNIILNGIQAARDGVSPEVDISIEETSMGIRITFKDNGQGIDPTLVNKIFIPHFTTKQSGSGLGLAIAKQGIEQMGGTIGFETSEVGSSFFIELKCPN